MWVEFADEQLRESQPSEGIVKMLNYGMIEQLATIRNKQRYCACRS